MAANITNEFIKRLVANAESMRDMKPGFLQTVIIPWGLRRGAQMLTRFRNKVRAGGDWDFKDNWLKNCKDSGVEVAGKHYRFDMPGNFHYGYVGCATEIPDSILFSEAGRAQRSAGTSRPEYHCTNGDDPEDHEFIRLGIKLYDDVGLDVTESNLAMILSGFKTIQCGPVPPPVKVPIMPRVAGGPGGRAPVG
jgi:hypothetical protein